MLRNCEEARRALADADPAAAVSAEVADHLRDCAECRAHALEWRAVDGWLRRRAPAVPPSMLLATILARVEAERRARGAALAEAPRREAYPIALAAACLLGALGLWFALAGELPAPGPALAGAVSLPERAWGACAGAATGFAGQLAGAVANVVAALPSTAVPGLPDPGSASGLGLVALLLLGAAAANTWLLRPLAADRSPSERRPTRS
ncbi:MAG: hypothetical protein HZA54_09695 [Planctomycetes bacterium]|nr:hypothetical protein [Planctomycetota bacterium]